MWDNIALEGSTAFLITFVVALFILIYFLKYSGKTYTNLPPGPPPYPVIGNILDIGKKDLGDYFDECRRKYGDVFCLRIFRKVIIVFNGYDVIKEAFVHNSHLFSERHAISILSEFKVNEEELVSIVGDLFAAGSETSATALKWGIVHLLRDREMQTELYEELKTNVPNDRLPGVEDKIKLPCLEATVLEILRHGNIIPFAVPHAVIRDCTFRGYTIPQEATILPNLQSVLYDESTWMKPEQFQPSRFITNEGKPYQNKEFIPFSTGRRSCAGESLARMELFLFFSAMVQRFEFLPPEGEDPPSLDAALGVTRAPKPFMMRAIKR